MSTKTDGPKVTIKAGCFDCIHERGDHYAVQGDSGVRVSCAHPSLPAPRRIGDTTWDTPGWCPLLTSAIETAIDVWRKRSDGPNRGRLAEQCADLPPPAPPDLVALVDEMEGAALMVGGAPEGCADRYQPRLDTAKAALLAAIAPAPLQSSKGE